MAHCADKAALMVLLAVNTDVIIQDDTLAVVTGDSDWLFQHFCFYDRDLQLLLRLRRRRSGLRFRLRNFGRRRIKRANDLFFIVHEILSLATEVVETNQKKGDQFTMNLTKWRRELFLL